MLKAVSIIYADTLESRGSGFRQGENPSPALDKIINLKALNEIGKYRSKGTQQS